MIQTQNNTVTYVVTEQQGEYLFPYKFYRKEDLSVFLGSSVLIMGSDWTVEEKEDYSDGAVITLKRDTANTIGADGKKLTIQRVLSLTQGSSFPTHGKLDSNALEQALDKLTMIAQQLFEKSGRSIVLPPGSDSADLDALFKTIAEVKHEAESALESAAEATSAADLAADLLRQTKEIQELVEEALKKSAGVPIGAVYFNPGALPPPGTYILNGQTIDNCRTEYKEFWKWVTTAQVRRVDNDTFEAELRSAGVCGGFVVDDATGSVRLPNGVNGTLWGADPSTVGQSLAPGLPDITGTFGNIEDAVATGAFRLDSTDDNAGPGTGDDSAKVEFKASLSNPVYGNSNTVQPPAFRGCFVIQVYNAATELSKQDSALLANQMQLKAQLDLANVDGNLDFVVESWTDGAGGWYRKYRSGWVEQGGYSLVNTGVQTITLWVEMADANYSASVSFSLTGTSTDTDGATSTPIVSNRTTTTIRLNQAKKSDDNSYWEVKGYAATE